MRSERKGGDRGGHLHLVHRGFDRWASAQSAGRDLVHSSRQSSVMDERLVRQGGCKLSVELEGEPVPVFGKALMVMQSLYLGLGAVLDGCAAGDTISLRVLRGDGPDGVQGEACRRAATIRISACHGKDEPDVTRLLPVMAELAGSCRADRGALELYYQRPCDESGDEL